MKRRDFLTHTSAAGFGALATTQLGKLSVTAQHSTVAVEEENDRILVVIQLFGGNDGLNTIIPVEVDAYYNLYRPKLQIPKSSSLGLQNTDLALHPSLRKGENEGLYGLYKDGRLAVIQGVGYGNPNFSHFRSMDIWLSAMLPQNDGQLLETGWLGRYFDKNSAEKLPDSPYSVHIGTTPSLIFQGTKHSTEVLLEDPNDFFNQGKNIYSEEKQTEGNSNFDKEYDYIFQIGEQSNHYSKSIKEAFDKGINQSNYSARNLSNQLKLVARLISGGLKTKIYFVSLDGFDTHSSQGTIDGIHAQLLADVSEAVGSFMADLDQQKLANKVVGMTVSEFGRRPEENGSFGTDHGTAGVMFVFGNEVKGKIYGKNLLELPLYESRNFVHQYDYRRVYWELLTTWFGASKSYATQVLGARMWSIEDGILKGTDDSDPPPPTVDVNNPTPIGEVREGGIYMPPPSFTNDGRDSFEIFPNPVGEQCTLKAILAYESTVAIKQYDMSGKEIGDLHKFGYKQGLQYIPLYPLGNPGTYLLVIRVNNRKTYHVRMIKM